MLKRVLLITLFLSLSITCIDLMAAPPTLPDGTEAAIKRIPTFRFPAGMKVELFAAEPQLASPVAIGLDERNRVYVAEEYRFNLGTEENRTRPFLLEDDLQIQTLEDRLKMYEKFESRFEGGMNWFRKVSDQIRLLEDTNHDGKADHSTIYGPDFNGILDGLAAGVMATDGDVYFTCIPNLWRLRDTNHDGVADERTIVHTGFGVNAGFLGHDLHGLCWGPDGKLYFSVGDRGFHVTTKEGQILHGPRTGAVFRCYPDGSRLEVVMRGLRNPQEIAFDQFGNLFAADNNCDKGDHSRLVFVLEGADAGWNMAHQSIPAPYLTGTWHSEKIWHLWTQESSTDPQRPAWVLPPVGKLGAGPSGFTYYPGTGLPPRYDHHFFLCNYTGNGGIESFSIQPRGAGFETIDEHDFLKPISATDCEFGYDGKLYVSDFVNLIWNGGSAGGRIYTLFDSQLVESSLVKETAELARNGFKGLSFEKLTDLLGHSDQRIRQRAQFELASRGMESLRFLQATLATSSHRLARLHALWGLGQISAGKCVASLDKKAPESNNRTENETPCHEACLTSIKSVLDDNDLEIRSHAISILGEHQLPGEEVVRKLLSDSSIRVRMFTALAIARSKSTSHLTELIELLRENNNSDPWLRHAVVMALTNHVASGQLTRHETDASPAVRMGILLAYRQAFLLYTSPWSDPRNKAELSDNDAKKVHQDWLDANDRIARFLMDERWELVTESARVINDFSQTNDSSRQRLADLAGRLQVTPAGPPPEALVRRVINACLSIGDEQRLAQVVHLASRQDLSPVVRKEAILTLMDWTTPPSRDRVTGVWVGPVPANAKRRDAVQTTLAEQLPKLLTISSPDLQTDIVKLITKYELPTDDAVFASWVSDSKKDTSARTAALRLLSARRAKQFDETLGIALKSDAPHLRSDARELLATIRPEEAVTLLESLLANEEASTFEQQRAIETLANMKTPNADKVLKQWTLKLISNQLKDGLRLDVYESSIARDFPDLKEPLEQLRSKLSSGDLLSRHTMSLHGGDVERGREIFVGHRVGQCVRCHKVGEVIVGGNAGPNLHEVAKRHDRLSLLQSLVDPNAKIAKGFETVTLVTTEGKTIGGVIRKEDSSEILIEQPDGKIVSLKPTDVEERTSPKSAMPEMNRALSARELRDLVEFLSQLK